MTPVGQISPPLGGTNIATNSNMNVSGMGGVANEVAVKVAVRVGLYSPIFDFN